MDDPVEAVGIHGFGGMWGVIATGLFANADFVTEGNGYRVTTINGAAVNVQRHYGWWMGDSPQLFFAQLIWAAVIIGWVSFNMIPFFFGMRLAGFLRVSTEMERAGLDASHHGGSAYEIDGAAAMMNGKGVSCV